MQLRVILSALFTTALFCSLSQPATAQDGNEREIQAAMKKVSALNREAEELRKAGRVNQAERLRKQSKELQARIARAQARSRTKPAGHGEAREGKERRGSDDYHGVFHHLEQAIESLRKLGLNDHARRLQEHAKHVRVQLAERHGQGEERVEHRERTDPRKDPREDPRKSREQLLLQRELRGFHLAKEMYREIRNARALELVEHSMHARELRLAGRRDAEARKVLHGQPKWGAEVELLNYAALHYKKHGKAERAAVLSKLANQIANRNKANGSDKKKLTERQVAEQQLEIMTYATGVLKKAGRAEAAKSLWQAATALKMRLAGRRDEEARRVYEKAPDRRANAAHLGLAAEILTKKGDRGHAKAVATLAKQFQDTANRVDADRRKGRGESEHREGEHREGTERPTDSHRRIRELELRVIELQEVLRDLQAKNRRNRRKI